MAGINPKEWNCYRSYQYRYLFLNVNRQEKLKKRYTPYIESTSRWLFNKINPARMKTNNCFNKQLTETDYKNFIEYYIRFHEHVRDTQVQHYTSYPDDKNHFDFVTRYLFLLGIEFTFYKNLFDQSQCIMFNIPCLETKQAKYNLHFCQSNYIAIADAVIEARTQDRIKTKL